RQRPIARLLNLQHEIHPAIARAPAEEARERARRLAQEREELAGLLARLDDGGSDPEEKRPPRGATARSLLLRDRFDECEKALNARREARALDLEPSPAAVEHLRQHGDERAVPAREVTRVEDEAPDALVEYAGDGVGRRKAASQSPDPCDPDTHRVWVDAGRGQRRLLHPTATAS